MLTLLCLCLCFACSVVQWISQNDIKLRTIYDLQLVNQLLLESLHAVDLADLITKDTDGTVVKNYRANLVAIAGWQSLLDYNKKLKDEAVEWTDFYQVTSGRQRRRQPGRTWRQAQWSREDGRT